MSRKVRIGIAGLMIGLASPATAQTTATDGRDGVRVPESAFAPPAPLERAQVPETCEGVASLVRARGHQEVGMHSTDSILYVFYDDRTSRQPLREALEIRRLVATEIPECTSLHLVPARFGMDLPPVSDGAGSVASLGRATPRSIGGPRIDLEVETILRYRVDHAVDPIRTHLAIAPHLRVWWPSGWSVGVQYAITLQNQIPAYTWRYFDTGYVNRAAAGYRRRVGRSMMVGTTAGLFARNRYGFDLQAYREIAALRMVVGVRASLTGYWSLYEGQWSSTRADEPTGYLDVTAYLPFHDLRIRGRAGIFHVSKNAAWPLGENLVTEPGVKLDVARTFHEVEVGFSAFLQESVVYPAIHLSLPLAPRRGLTKGRMAAYVSPRLELPWAFGRTVRGSATGFVDQDRGETFSSGQDLWPDLRFQSQSARGIYE